LNKKFEDNFSAQSGQYAQYRPSYPDSLYAYLASIVPGHSLAWDCGTGNGQAAIGLAKYFEHIHASDASADQIKHAVPHDRVSYHVEEASQAALESGSVDLVTVAQAVHWFDLDAFYKEVKRVLKPGGVIAVWTYHLCKITPQVDQASSRFYYEVLKGYWSDRIGILEDRYQSMFFPFEEIDPPSLQMETHGNRAQFMGFLDSWSAVQKYLKEKGTHPLEQIWDELLTAWPDETEVKPAQWPLYFRIGRMPA